MDPEPELFPAHPHRIGLSCSPSSKCYRISDSESRSSELDPSSAATVLGCETLLRCETLHRTAAQSSQAGLPQYSVHPAQSIQHGCIDTKECDYYPLQAARAILGPTHRSSPLGHHDRFMFMEMFTKGTNSLTATASLKRHINETSL